MPDVVMEAGAVVVDNYHYAPVGNKWPIRQGIWGRSGDKGKEEEAGIEMKR
jgi:hypothetical protein